VATVLVAGCIPEKRVVWSSNGERAAVATPNGLFLIDAEGTVLAPRLMGSPVRCDWFGDNRRLAIAHKTTAEKWEDVGDMFSPQQTAEVKALAKTLRRRALAHEGDWDQFQVDPDDKIAPNIEIGARLYLRDHLAEGLPEKLGDKWDELKQLRPDVYQLQIFTITQDKLKPGKVLVRAFGEIYRVKVAPNDKNIALLMPLVGGPGTALHVVSCEGGEAQPVAENVGLAYDWGPDGCCLAFIRGLSPGFEHARQGQLGALTTVRIAKKDGSLLWAWEAQVDLVMLLYNDLSAVRWLSDGRLLFSSSEGMLPTTMHDMPQRWSLFIFDPKMPATVHRVLGRDFAEPLEASMPLFQLSPDEKRVLLPGPHGQVILHDFASGTTKALVDPASPADKVKSLPAWRDNSQICLVRPAGNEQKGYEVVLWQDGEANCISGSWPQEMKEGWLVGE
jgi:hypothetical protein